jgi:uncharacterized membrane protein
MMDILKIKQIFLLGFILLIIDVAFINLVLKDHFNKLIKRIQNSDIKVKYLGAIFTYILMCFSLYYFVIKDNKSIQDAFLLGVFIYGIYEGTNYSLLKHWTLKTVFIDTIWGGVLYALSTCLFYNIRNMFNN